MPLMKDPVKIERNCWRIYGCSLEFALRLNGGDPLRLVRTPAMLYCNQRTASSKRGIEWCLTFPQWMAIWQESGKWEQRGCGQGYVMARKGDVGPYAVGNVYICTQSQNAKDAFVNKPARTRERRVSEPPKGYWFDAACKTNPYRVKARGSYVGSFASPDEAQAAYRQAVEAQKFV
jgi:hypothetical protein